VAELFALAAATTVLVMIPGPNVALIVANSLRYGARMGVATVLGTTLGVALQLLFVVCSSL
jgi:threonine/homoserine/homoserine lactone efflux protein